MEVVDQIFKLRKDFIVIGLTGRTGSGCTTVAKIMSTEKASDIKSEYREFNNEKINNNTRKERIVAKFISSNWRPFFSIKASDIIFYYALMEEFDTFVDSLLSKASVPNEKTKKGSDNLKESLLNILQPLKPLFEELHGRILECDEFLESKKYSKVSDHDELNDTVESFCKLIFNAIPDFRTKVLKALSQTNKKMLATELQQWGNNIRLYNSITKKDKAYKKAPSCLAHKINQIIKMLRELDKRMDRPTLIVIDALRNPFEVLYFRERYSAFYLMSVNTTEKVRMEKLFQKGYRLNEVQELDNGEKEKKNLSIGFQEIDIDKCIELSDIHLTHDGTADDKNRDLISQIFRYIALILHPGLIPPSPYERIMQIAYTAKLNSGCLSRQVGAAVTNDYFSVMSVGWNTSAEGQTPCTLRSLYDLYAKEDEDAYSTYEKEDEEFTKYIKEMKYAYDQVPDKDKRLSGVSVSFCFKDIHNQVREKQLYNQVHTRSLHAEENAFLQLAKYGSVGVKGGKLFTTASCCELCAKKAYQLGIKEIYYIDAYPGISQRHILESGPKDNRPEMKLFSGAIGRAYINLYNPLLPLKDEIEERTNVKVKEIRNPKKDSEKEKKEINDGGNNKN